MGEKMIFIFTDPGLKGAISAIDENEQILFSVGLENGLPPEDFIREQGSNNEFYCILTTRTLAAHKKDWHFGIEIADWKNAEMIKAKINLNTVYRSGINTGLIIQWFTARGVHDMLQIKPREWQTIYKGFAGKDSKERALNCLKEKYCDHPWWTAENCKYCDWADACSLKKHGIIGPRGGYIDGKGDSVCGAIHLKNTVRQRKVR